MFSFYVKIWFFDSCRSWFFDFCRPPRQIEAQIQRNFKRKLRNSSNYLKIIFTTIKIISGAWCDTADDNKLETRSQEHGQVEQQQRL